MKYSFLFLTLCSTSFIATAPAEPQEIELKFKLSPQHSEKFKQNIAQKASQPVTMDETYFMGPELQPTHIKGYKKMSQYLRIRRTDKGCFITLKKRADNSVVEYETGIADPMMMTNILRTLGYGTDESDCVHLNKQRTKYNVTFEGHVIEVVFDTFSEPAHMKDMGEFIEVELKSAAPSYEDGIAVLKKFLLSQGITKIDVYPPYVELAINQQYADHIRHIELK